MKLISYAQNREDIVLNRAFANQAEGFYVDIGANDPWRCSISCLFSQRGWRGINVEPGKTAFGRLVSARQRDINCNVGISDRAGFLRFFEVENVSTLSTFSEEAARCFRQQGMPVRECLVPVVTLAQLCAEHVTGPIDFMSIDVENHELEVIQGGDWARWRPRALVVEDSIGPDGMRNHPRWQPLLLKAGYLPALFDGINRFFVREEDKDLLANLSVPANCLDGFDCWQDVLGQTSCYHDVLGVTSLEIAQRLHALSRRFPRTGALVKRLAHFTHRTVTRVARMGRAPY
jgi:FkbM family methyltransferase